MGRNSNSPAVKIMLPLLAAVLLLTGACGKSGKPSPSSGKETSLPDGRPDITGTITEVGRGDPGTNSIERILVEEDPDFEHSEGPNTEGWEKLYFEVTDETRIFIRRGGDRGEVRPASAADLAKGQTVNAWHTGHAVMESYPGQTVASEVMISSSPRTRPAVFFPRQVTDSGPIWPVDFEVDASGDETRVLDENVRVVGRVGERIYLGGEIPIEALEGNDLMEKPLLRELLERCPGGYWLVAAE
ncbi:MAG: YobA family protein [Actinomycetota bacterium]|nr:YobA family protein [Actinomycetota bacterium]